MTKRFTIAAALVIAVVDAAFVVTGTQTISEYLYLSAKDNPIVALVAGILVGHIFWPVKVSNQ
jgi:hypothetical protein